MTSTAAGTGTSTRPGPAVSAPAPSRRRRAVFPVAIALAVLVAAAVAAVASSGTSSGDLDPDSGAPGGSRAVARILTRQGVSVTRVADATQAAGRVRAGGALVVVHTELLSPEGLRSLRGSVTRLVLVEPDATALEAIGATDVRADGVEAARTVPPECSSTAAVGPARAGGTVYVAEGPDAVVCYPDREHRPRTGSLVELPDGTVLVGQADVLRNAYLDQDANAALALRLLGASADLVWLVPDPLRAGDAGPASLRDVAPPAVGWVVGWLAVVVVLALLWRARRLGPLVREPLPVVVRSAETLQGRARLYRRARATGRAAATLRTAAARRLAARLAVDPEAGPDAVAVRAAEAAGTDLDAVRALLLGPPPPDERGLVALADALDGLERRAGGPPGPAAGTPSSTAPTTAPTPRGADR
jgi:hypothetical protein